jgi:hypothetical protein
VVVLAVVGLVVVMALGWFWTRAGARGSATPAASIPDTATTAAPPAAALPAAPAAGTLGERQARARATDGVRATVQPVPSIGVPRREAAPSRPKLEPPVTPPASSKAGAPAEAAPAATPTVAISTENLKVVDHAVGTGVVDRRLVGRSDRFAGGSGVAFWTQVVGGQPGQVVRHTWFEDGRAVMKVDLRIAGGHWRTHSRLQLPEGCSTRWAVEARTADGRVLARNEFSCDSVGGQ